MYWHYRALFWSCYYFTAFLGCYVAVTTMEEWLNAWLQYFFPHTYVILGDVEGLILW